MKIAPLITSIAVIVVANALALVHGLRNRVGAPEAEITMTQRELQYFNRSLGDDDSGVSLQLAWTEQGNFPWPAQVEKPGSWLDRQKLQTLGFDCSVIRPVQTPSDTISGSGHERCSSHWNMTVRPGGPGKTPTSDPLPTKEPRRRVTLSSTRAWTAVT